MMLLHNAMLALMLLAACGIVFSRNLIRSLIWLSTFSVLLTLQYVLLRAPDVAITEAALGTGLSTLVFLTAIRKTRASSSQEKTNEKEGN